MLTANTVEPCESLAKPFVEMICVAAVRRNVSLVFDLVKSQFHL